MRFLSKLLPVFVLGLFVAYSVQAQTPITPSDGATAVVASTNAVTWTDFDDGNGNGPYDVDFDDDAGFGSIDYSAANTSATSLTVAVTYNTTYYWRVRDTDIDGAGTDGSWHSYSFTTELATPSLVDPSGTYAANTTLNWNMSGNYSNVDFAYAVATDNAFTNIVASGTVSGALTTTVSLPSAGEYYWRVVATVNDATAANNGETKTSSTQHFTLTIPGPALTAPVNGLTGVSIEPTMQWQAVTGAVSYKLYVDDASDFATPIYEANEGTNLSRAFTEAITNFPLNNGATYYWRVASVDNAGNEYLSSTYHFTTFPDVSPTLNNPGNAETVYVNPVMLGWSINQPTGTLKFKLQYQETDISDVTEPTAGEWAADGTGNDATSVITTNTTYSLSVHGGKKYYWRVIVLNASNEVEDYSSVYYFITSGGASVTVYPSYPIGGATVYTNSPTLYWYVDQYASGVTYQVRYATSNSVDANGELNDASAVSEPTNANIATATSALYKTLSGLNPGTTYYWQVRGYYAATGEYSDWSTVESFTTNGSGTLVVPTVSYPTGGVTVYTTSPYLYWYIQGTGLGLTYDVEVDNDNSFATPEYTGSTTTNVTYIQASGLTPGDTYYWRVRSNNGTSTSAWSSTGQFSVDGGVTNGYPVATYPTGNPTVYTPTPTLYWYLEGSSLGLTKYVVRWKEGSNSTNWATDYDGTADVTNLNTTYYTFTSNLTYGSTYYWAVASYDGSTYSAWSAGSFTVVGPGTAGAPILSAPENGTTVYDRDVTLSWYVNGSTTGIQSYEVTYSTSDVFESSVTTTTTTTSNSLALTGLTPGATYYWKVRSYYGGSTYSGFSSTYHFTVNPGSSPVTPLPGSPNNVDIAVNSPVLSWILPAQSEAQLTYTVEYSTTPDFSNPIVVDNVENPFVQISGLEANQHYYWRVKSAAGDNESYYSPVGDFTTYGVTAVGDEVSLPETYQLSQNYPNPFNPTTIIKFQLPKESFVSLKVYDITGKEIKTLLNGNISAGYHSVSWNATDNDGRKVSSGIYFYRITTPEFSSVKKMMLLK
jgi:hypothetical protein